MKLLEIGRYFARWYTNYSGGRCVWECHSDTDIKLVDIRKKWVPQWHRIYVLKMWE